MDITAIILAGGKSSRMGSDKGLLCLNGTPMISHIIYVLEEMKLPIIIISNNIEYNQFGYPVYEDIIKEKGPAGGILTGLSNSTTETNLVISCDSPFISAELLNFLLKNHDTNTITFPKHNDKIHPLIGVYSKNCYTTFEKSIEQNNLKIREIIKSLHPQIINLEESLIPNISRNLSNINNPSELKKLEP